MESESTIGIKRRGELNPKPFLDECKKKFAGDDWCLKSEQLFLLWQQHIKNPLWHPFKIDPENKRVRAFIHHILIFFFFVLYIRKSAQL